MYVQIICTDKCITKFNLLRAFAVVELKSYNAILAPPI